MKETYSNRYILAFVTDLACEYGLFIKRTKDDWQKNMINGIGGKIEQNESITEALLRELEEEANITNFASIVHIARMYRYNDFECFVYHIKINDIMKVASELKPLDEGIISVYNINYLLTELKDELVHNLTWLIPYIKNDIFFLNNGKDLGAHLEIKYI